MAALFSKKHRMIQTEWTVEYVLSVLQGGNPDELNVEILRKEMIKTKLPILCRDAIERDEDSVRELLENNFSLYDLKNVLSGKLKEYSSAVLKEALDTETELKESLKKQFACENRELQEILRGLQQYYSLWNTYVIKCAESIYLEKLAEFTDQLDTSNYQKLFFAKTVLENAMYSETSAAFGENEKKELEKQIRSWEDLLESLRRYISHAEYLKEDIAKMIANADKRYQNTGEMHVDSSRHPNIHMVFHREFEEQGERENHYFEWTLHAVDYAPKSVMWEVRIYTYGNEKAGTQNEA